MKKKIFAFLILFLSAQMCLAENVSNTTIRVKIVDKDFVTNEGPKIRIYTSSYPFSGLEFSKSKDTSYEQEAVKQGNIFIIRSPSDVFYMHISYLGKSLSIYYGIENIYTIKAGSNLNIELDKKDIKISGEGSRLPNIQNQIIRHRYQTSNSLLELLESKDYQSYLKQFDKSLDSALELQFIVIEKNKERLSDDEVKLLTANCYGYRYFNQLRGYDYLLVQNEAFFDALKKYFSNKSNIPKSPNFTSDVLEKSPIFANYLIEKMNILERIEHEQYLPRLSEFHIRNILKKINHDYSGIFRGKLLTLFVLHTENNRNAVPFLNEILNSVKSNKYNTLLVGRIKRKQVNVPFKNFELQDENGKIHTLMDFKNKVVVLDFWFTGCENCGILNQAMKPIMRYFSENDRIKFVSVSIDQNKDQWLKSIQTGNYTHPENVNLFTNGEGANHELTKYYNITAYPTVFIIKDGLMFSSLPPRPSLNIQSSQNFSPSEEKLVELLEKALK